MDRMDFRRGDYPDKPGVYLIKDDGGSVIYVGKASSLRTRLSSYFARRKGGKTERLMEHASSIDFVVTKSPNEALILESNLIKEHQPRYNMVLKDAKHFSYLAVTREPFPRLLTARKNSKGRFRIKDARFFGPYVDGSKRGISSRYLRKLFRIRTCKRLPKKECLQFHIGNCDAPCAGRISAEDYTRNVEALCKVLEGKRGTRDLIGALGERMKRASDSLDYELAASLRNQIEALRIFLERQQVERVRRTDEDFISFRRIGGALHAQVLKSRAGVIRKADKHSMDIREQESPELSFLLQYYTELPHHVYTDLSEEDTARINGALGTDAFKVPGKEKRKLLEIASESLAEGKVDPSVMRLKEELGLDKEPVVIETFDISTLFGEDSVGSMVRFVNGKRDASGYRRYRIRMVDGQDDYSMMEEVVRRRYRRLLDEGQELPDLVLIDGGAGQLGAAMSALDEVGISLPVAAIAKREEEIYLPSMQKPLRIKRGDAGLRLLQRCRDEAHRFAVAYHRKRRAMGQNPD